MKRIVALVLLTATTSLFLHSASTSHNIHDIHSFRELLAYVPKDADVQSTLIVSDIDNTLLELNSPKGHGSDQWFEGALHHLKELGHGFHKALEMVLPHYFHAHFNHDARAVELETSGIIHRLQQQNYPLIAITARSLPIVKRTCEQLRSIGIDLRRTSILKKDVLFKDLTHLTIFTDGIVFCNNNDKGTVLKKLLEEARFTPKHIIVIDDKKSHLERLEATAHELGCRFTGLRYGHLDDKVKQFVFDPAIHFTS